MLILTHEDVRRAVPMDQAMDAVAAAFAQLSSGQADAPLRLSIDIPAHDATALFMPAYLPASEALGAKLLTLFPHNPARLGTPAIAALVVLFDSANGRPLALLDGAWLTALRTGAASGVATRLMARRDARSLALFGAGAQALAQAWAVCVARPIERVWLVNRTEAHAERLAEELRGFGAPIPGDVRVADSAREALQDARVICCATGASTPLFAAADIQPGTHINAIGAYRPTAREVPTATVAAARVVVDQRAAAWAEAGDLIIARQEGAIDTEHIVAELGALVAGVTPGRLDDAQITIFKSVGAAVQDVAVARLAVTRAQSLGLGAEVAL